MTQPKKPAENKSEDKSATGQRKKKPYERPQVTFREPLEGVASICNPPGKGAPPCTFASS
jgi:hypothetical protein